MSLPEEHCQKIKMEGIEGFDQERPFSGDYPIDGLLIRHETLTVYDVASSIEQDEYILNLDIDREFFWPDDKQSKLIESIIMRIPLPAIYVAEDKFGRRVVVDGLQRLSTIQRFLNDKLKLKLPCRQQLDKKRFSDLPPNFQNRVEDCRLVFHVVDSKVPEGVRLDIFERVNGETSLTRQQMRNCLHTGKATTFLMEEARTEIFLDATGRSLDAKAMRDREFINRFCAFQTLGTDAYDGDMDHYLACGLEEMNEMDDDQLSCLSKQLHRGLANNLAGFEHHAFRKHIPGRLDRVGLNVSFWDVMSTGLSRYDEHLVKSRADGLRTAIHDLLEDPKFNDSITQETNTVPRVKTRFAMAQKVFQEILGDISHRS